MNSMKKSVLIFIGLLGIITACSNSKRAEQEEQMHEDSLRAADSIARVEAMEAARLDSIRQDSIGRQQEKLQKAMPTVQLFGKNLQDMGGGMLTDVKVLRKKLVELGYEKLSANKFVLNPGGEPSVTVVIDYEEFEGEYDSEMEDYVGGGMTYSIDISFSDEADATKFYKNWKAVCRTPWVTADKSGKTIKLYTYAD